MSNYSETIMIYTHLNFFKGDDRSVGRAGAPLTVNDFIMTSWSEGGYTIHDKPYPRGEIIIGKKHFSETNQALKLF